MLAVIGAKCYGGPREREMKRTDIVELHYISPLDNVVSIFKHGILSHTLAEKVLHQSIAMPEIQERRKNKEIPGAGCLHDYANLYFDAHNPMLSKRRGQNDEICILRINPAVLDLPGVIVTDRNAASGYVLFMPSAKGVRYLDHSRVFAASWIHRGDPQEERNHKAEKCAEVLIPRQVNPQYIIGAYVVNPMALARFQALKTRLPVCIKSDIFF